MYPFIIQRMWLVMLLVSGWVCAQQPLTYQPKPPTPKFKITQGDFAKNSNDGGFIIGKFNDTLIYLHSSQYNSVGKVQYTRQGNLLEQLFFYSFQYYDARFRLLNSVPIKFNSNEAFDIKIYVLNREVHIFYSIQTKDNNIELHRNVYTLSGSIIRSEFLVSRPPLTERRILDKSDSTSPGYYLVDTPFEIDYQEQGDLLLIQYGIVMKDKEYFFLREFSSGNHIDSASITANFGSRDSTFYQPVILNRNKLILEMYGDYSDSIRYSRRKFFLFDFKSKSLQPLNIDFSKDVYVHYSDIKVHNDGSFWIGGRLVKKGFGLLKFMGLFLAKFNAVTGDCIRKVEFYLDSANRNFIEWGSQFYFQQDGTVAFLMDGMGTKQRLIDSNGHCMVFQLPPDSSSFRRILVNPPYDLQDHPLLTYVLTHRLTIMDNFLMILGNWKHPNQFNQPPSRCVSKFSPNPDRLNFTLALLNNDGQVIKRRILLSHRRLRIPFRPYAEKILTDNPKRDLYFMGTHKNIRPYGRKTLVSLFVEFRKQ